ncbi:hypothetical protein LBMAG47_26890 [Planctomycetia bacterium]|nr:hypothetical protein LBMAG47_26890 [Planctomycetia bacterium]
MTHRAGLGKNPDPDPRQRLPEHGRLRHHDRDRPRKPVADHAHLSDGIVFRERPLHLGRRQFHAAGKHQCLAQPAHDRHMAVGVDLGEIAGLDPGIGSGHDHRRRPASGVGRDENATGAARRAHEQLPPRAGTLVEADVDPGQRRSHRAGPGDPRIGNRHDRSRFGEPVSLDQRHAGGGEALGRAPPQRSAPGNTDADAAAERGPQVGDPARSDAALQPLERGRHAEHHRGGEAATGVEQPRPIADDVEAAAADERGVEIAGAGHGMAQRQPGKPHVPRIVEKHLGRRRGVDRQRPLRMHEAVRMARRTRRQEDRAAGVRIAGGDAGGEFVPQQRQVGGKRSPLRRDERGGDADPRRCTRRGIAPQRRFRESDASCGPDCNSTRIEPVDEPALLLEPAPRMQRHVHDPRQQAGEVDDDPLRRMGGGVDEPVAGTQAGGLEAARQHDGGRREFGPREDARFVGRRARGGGCGGGRFGHAKSVHDRPAVRALDDPGGKQRDEGLATGRQRNSRRRVLLCGGGEERVHAPITPAVPRAPRSPGRGRCTSSPGRAGRRRRPARERAWS